MRTALAPVVGEALWSGDADALARLLAEARRVYVTGLRSCYPVAFFFHYSWRLFEDKPVLLEFSGPG